MIINGFLRYGLYTELELKNSAIYLIFAVLCIVVPYLLGSLNFAVIISRTRFHEDVRGKGSGNGGTTNMLRSYGKRAAVLTLLCDMLKGVAAALFGCSLLGLFGGWMAGFFVVFGHSFPVFFKFKGGKGVATAAAVMAVLYPIVFGVVLISFIIVVAGTRYVSLGSVVCAMIYPLLVNRFDLMYDLAIGYDTVFAFMTAVLVLFMHRENIKRLLAGKESKVSFKKKEKESENDNGKQ